MAHRSARSQHNGIRSLLRQSFRHNGRGCIPQQAPVRDKAHKAKVKWRDSPYDTLVRRFAQPVDGKDTVGIGVSVARVIMRMIYSDGAGWRIAWNLAKTGITMRIEQIMRWLA